MRKMLTLVPAVLMVLAITPLAQTQSPGVQGFERLKLLAGEWIDADGTFGTKGAVAATYKVSGGGHTVIETFPLNKPEEMVTVYHLDGRDVVLTHYCAGGTQPRMRSKGLTGNVLTFDFDGGANIDQAKTSHMHAAQLEFISADEIRGTWTNWSNGKPDDHKATFRLTRKK